MLHEFETDKAEIGQNDQEKLNADRKPYFTPRLELLGDLRSITLGGSIQTQVDSGGVGNPHGAWAKKL